MAAHEWDWFQREGFIGQLSDIRVQNLQVERENVQKRTFTRWINLHLEKCDPPLEVKDLFIDIQDGKILMALLEVLSGRNLLHEYKSSSHRIFRLNNIAKALKFLEDSNVKLVSIDAAEIADGNPSLVLGLIWNIILFFQIKELTGNLSRNSPSSSLSPSSGGTDSDSSFPPTPTAERNAALSLKDQRKAIKTLLAWVQRKTRKYGVAVQDFAGSWRSGLAFLAVIKAIDPSLVDMKQALEDSTRENLEKAFSIAHDALHIPRLLEPEDIMVDVPDEQSIVTYVAQFLEHFPELETEDFVDSDREFPIESTFVRIKETPSEEESKVFFVTENGERAYTINHETSHPPPAKVFVCDRPESVGALPLQPCLEDAISGGPPDSPGDLMDQIIDQVLQDIPYKAGDVSELSPETSILSSRKDSRRANSLPTKKTVHFEADTYRDASCSKDPACSQGVCFEGNPRGTKESLNQDRHTSAIEEDEGKKPKQEAPKTLEAASDKALDAVPLADGKANDSQSSQGSPAWSGAPGRTADHEGESHSLASAGENTPQMADSLEIQDKVASIEVVDKEDYFESIPLKACKFNSDLVDSACTSQALDETPSLRENKPSESIATEEQAEKPGKRRAKSSRRKEASSEPEVPSDQHGLHMDPGPGAHGSSLAPEEVPVDKEPEVYEKAKQKSTHRGGDEEEEDEGFLGDDRELPSSPPSSSVSLETLRSHSEEGLDLRPSPPLSKTSVIPHNLFYYPHYEVPLTAVLEAYTEGLEDLRNDSADLEDPDNYRQDLDSMEEGEDCHGGCSFSVTGKDLPKASDQVPYLDREAVGTQPAPDPVFPAHHEDHHQGETKESNPSETGQSQQPLNSENLASLVEEKVTEESISSKKKEKRKHVDHVESSIFTAPGTVRSSDDLEEEPAVHRIPSRTSRSDSSIYVHRHTNRSLESDHCSYVQLRNAAEGDDRRNRMLTRYNTQRVTELISQFSGIRADMKRGSKQARMSMKANNSGEATLLDSHSPLSDSLTQLVHQPDMVYFILFLWLLVYCLLLFPQLDVNRL